MKRSTFPRVLRNVGSDVHSKSMQFSLHVDHANTQKESHAVARGKVGNVILRKIIIHLVKSFTFGILFAFGFLAFLHGSFDEIFVNNSDQRVIFVEAQFSKKGLSDLVNVTDDN